MFKRKADGTTNKKKHTPWTGYTFHWTKTSLRSVQTIPLRVTCEWGKVMWIKVKKRSIVWCHVDDTSTLMKIKTPVPTGMIGLLIKSQPGSGRRWESLPGLVKEHFNLNTKTAFDQKKLRYPGHFMVRFFIYVK